MQETEARNDMGSGNIVEIKLFIERSKYNIDYALDKLAEAWQDGDIAFAGISAGDYWRARLRLDLAKINDNMALILLRQNNTLSRVIARTLLSYAINYKESAKDILEQ